MDLRLTACGFLVGALVGITGMGGGSVMTALLIVLFGVHPVSAVGTDLLYAAVTKMAGMRVHASKGNVVWPIVGWLAAGSLPGTAAMLALLAYVPSGSQALTRTITIILGLALIISSAAILLHRRQMPPSDEDEMAQPAVRPLATALLGVMLGGLVSLTSVGAGALGLVALRLIYPHARALQLVGSDIAHAVPLTLLAGTGHWFLGDVDWRLLISLLVGSIPGIMISSHLAHRVPDRALQVFLAIILAFIGARLVLS